MSYIINKSNGAKLVAIEDGSINVTACDLTLLGKNYAGYGESVATNFVKLLENFSNTKQPAKPLTGQIWYDSGNKKIKFYNGIEFKTIPAMQSSPNYPSDQYKGDLHYNETEGRLYYFDGSRYVLVGPQVTGKAAANTILPILLQGTDDTLRYVLAHQIQNYYDESEVITVAITSDADFTPVAEEYAATFPKIKRGINLRATDSSSGVSTTSTNGGYMVWGTAADSIRLAGRLESEYVRYSTPIFGTQVQVNNANGVNIYNRALQLFSNPNGAQITTENTRLSFSASDGGQLYNIINIDAGESLALLPSRTPATLVNIGSVSNPFNDVYANRIFGEIQATAGVAAVAQTVTLNATNSVDAVHYILFTDSASGNEAVRTDSGLTFNPSTNTVTGNLTGNVTGNLTGNVTGNLTGNVTGNLTGTPTAPSITKSGTSSTGDIGQTDNRFGTVYAKATSAQYADLAEKYLADAEYEPGTVLRLGGTAEVTICATYESEAIAGIVSTNPAYIMNDTLENGVAIALKGRVPCKVKGSIKKGDVLVSSSTPGHAEVRKYGHRTNPLAVLGKALQDFDGDTGVIEIMIY
jgi:hypothetical protein